MFYLNEDVQGGPKVERLENAAAAEAGQKTCPTTPSIP